MSETVDVAFPPLWPWSVFSSTGVGPNFTVYRGSAFEFARTVYNSNGTAVDITGDTLTLTAKYNYGDASPVFTRATGGSGIVLTTPSSGIYTVTISASNTSGLPPYPVDLVYDIKRTHSGTVTTILSGIITVLPDVAS